VFDGGSMVVTPSGEAVARAAMFEEDLLVVDIGREDATELIARWPSGPEEVYRALVLGLGDYVRKNGFREVVVGVSGGIDSALVATLAADALGPDVVRAVAMPSPYSSPESAEDAEECARRLGARFDVIAIADVLNAYRSTLAGELNGPGGEIAQENIQARIRGNVLMAISNASGSLVLAPGNKSEYAVGYATLYGDMAGGFAPIKDVPKTLVYEVAAWRNAQDPANAPIPDRIMTKPPSAELRPDQLDTDSLPPYDVLDPIVEAYVEDDDDVDAIVARGFDRATVERVAQLIDRAEYKRRQAAPGVKITPKAFGRDRRLPITNRYGARPQLS
jgi:NAD+ synthase (glutamine-hydrolysing)